ncbi:hypothetical protein EK21DRAFT_112785 [Setomelanomma holmii]|uniref:Uncharacterized protein n=1 Tax=Setomelanomma holmii TaxID=210430 RepID=A0A9P4H8B9_9PLEO|nr:hypothetical protein EK21DRAFT_112785 [Setomelanomma holmii]
MPFRDHEWEDTQRDCSIFPAYTDYLYGLDLRPEVAAEPGLHPLLYLPHWSEPIRYTNSMPSRSMLYGRAPDAPHQMAAPDGSGPPLTGASKPSAVDLRSPPASSEMVKLISAELITPLPQSTRRPAANATPRRQPTASTETMREKLLNASQQRLATVNLVSESSSQRLLRNLKKQAQSSGSPELRRNPKRQATQPSLLRSSSATDVDSHLEYMTPHRPFMKSSPGLPTLPTSLSSLPEHPHCTEQMLLERVKTSDSAQDADSNDSSRLNIPFLRPGDLLADPCYAAAPRENLQTMNAQIGQYWHIAQNHPDALLRKQAMMEIQEASKRVYFMTQQWEQEAQMAVQARAQLMSPQLPQNYVHPPSLPKEYEGKGHGGRQYPVQLQVTPQHYPPQMSLPSPLEYQKQPVLHGLPLDQPFPPGDVRQRSVPHIIDCKVRANIEASIPNYLAANRLIEMPPTNDRMVAEQEQARTWQDHFRSQLPPEGQIYLDTLLAKVDATRQAASPLLQNLKRELQSPALRSQAHPPEQQVQHEALGMYIRSYLPKFFNALRIAQTSTNPSNIEAAPQQQLARVWMEKFKASLPPQGHQMMEEIVAQMLQAQKEGRDWRAEMGLGGGVG